MLERLRVRNFQIHKEYELEFGSQITSIIGASWAGKSTLLRALRWLALNRPSGDSFIRHGAKWVRVELEIDGHKIVRSKGKKGNRYLLDGEEYKALGQGVPDPISALLNVGEDGFQGQFSAPYWLSLTPGQVAKELNGVVNLNSIDSALAHIASRLRKDRAEREVSEGRLKQAEERREALSWVQQANEILLSLSTRVESLEQKCGWLLRINDLIESVSQAEEQKKVAVRAANAAERLCERVGAWREKQERLERLQKLIVTVEREQERCSDLATEISTLQKKMAEGSRGKCPLCGNPKWSPSADQTSTCPSEHPLREPEKRTGSEHRHESLSK